LISHTICSGDLGPGLAITHSRNANRNPTANRPAFLIA
jgi:hypothetical protein